jgi:hypothetical protein
MTFGFGDALVLISFAIMMIITIDLLVPPGPRKL